MDIKQFNPVPLLRHLTTNWQTNVAVLAPSVLATYCLTHATPRSVQDYTNGLFSRDYWLCLEAILVFCAFWLYARTNKWLMKYFFRVRNVHGRTQVEFCINATFFFVYANLIRPNFSTVGDFSSGFAPTNDWTACWISPIFDRIPFLGAYINLLIAPFFKTLFGGVFFYYCCILTRFSFDMVERGCGFVNWEKFFPGWLYIDLCDYFTGFFSICYRYFGWLLMHFLLSYVCTWTSTEFDYWLMRGCLTIAQNADAITSSVNRPRSGSKPKATRKRSTSGRKRSSSGSKKKPAKKKTPKKVVTPQPKDAATDKADKAHEE